MKQRLLTIAITILLTGSISNADMLTGSASSSAGDAAAGGTFHQSGPAGPISGAESGSGNSFDYNPLQFGALVSASASASVQVNYGVIKVAASSSGSAGGNASGSFDDTIHLSSSQLGAGVDGFLTYQILLNGSMSATAPGGFASWSLDTSIGQGGLTDGDGVAVFLDKCGNYFGNGSAVCGSGPADPLKAYSVTVPIDNDGAPLTFALHVFLAVSASSNYDQLSLATGSAVADLSHSMYWGGITLTAADGTPITDFTAIGDSGTDWSKSFAPGSTTSSAVPEPGTVLLVATFLPGMWLVRRRRSPGTNAK